MIRKFTKNREAKFICVIYDISNNRRRNKVWKILKSYGTPVQFSVFECWLDIRQIESMRDDLDRTLIETDQIRFYDICHSCHRASMTLGTGRMTTLDESYVF